jgi:hypothetical protein
MKALRVRRLLLFPRFHTSVKHSLESNPPEVCYFDPVKLHSMSLWQIWRCDGRCVSSKLAACCRCTALASARFIILLVVAAAAAAAAAICCCYLLLRLL